MLLDGVHGEAAGAIKPELLARAPEEFQESITISRRAVTEARSLARRPGPPDEFARADQKIVDPTVGKPAKQFTMPGAP